MDHSTAIQKQIANMGQKLTEIADELNKINNNPNIQGIKEHKEQEECVTNTLAHCYKFYNYIRDTLRPADSSRLSENAQRIAKQL